jgi:hypothetical protein
MVILGKTHLSAAFFYIPGLGVHFTPRAEQRFGEFQMETLMPKTLELEFELKELHYLQEQIYQIDNRIMCNKNAFSLGLIDSLNNKNYEVEDVVSLFNWSQPGKFYGKSFCKAYIKNLGKRCLYQAAIPDDYLQKLDEHSEFNGCLSFSLVQGENQAPKKSWVNTFLSCLAREREDRGRGDD